MVGLAVGTTGASAKTTANSSYTFVRPVIKYPVTNFVQYVIGTKGVANNKLSPITIGWINQQGGTADIAPQTTLGAQAAVQFLNKDAGGIDGHPVRLSSCYVPDTVSAASSCGLGFADNRNVDAVAVGQLDVGNQALDSTLSSVKMPVAWLLATGPSQQYVPGFSFNSDVVGEAGYATLAKYALHAKSVSIIYENIPGAAINLGQVQQAMQLDGIQTYVAGFDPSTTDLVPSFLAANAEHTDAIIVPTTSLSVCSDDYLAYKQLNLTTPVMSAVPCNVPAVATGDGGTLPNGWYYAAFSQLYSDPTDPSGPALEKVFSQFGNANGAQDAWQEDSFNEIMTIAQWESEVLHAGAPLTRANVTTVAKQFKGPIVFGAPVMKCGAFPSYPADCGNLMLIEQIFSNGKVVKNIPGLAKYEEDGWVKPPAGFVLQPPSS